VSETSLNLRKIQRDTIIIGARLAHFFEALRYKPEVAGLIPDGVTGISHSAQPLIEISNRNISWGQRRPVFRADKLTTFICLLS
jgi:hypothetical protein